MTRASPSDDDDAGWLPLFPPLSQVSVACRCRLSEEFERSSRAHE